MGAGRARLLASMIRPVVDARAAAGGQRPPAPSETGGPRKPPVAYRVMKEQGVEKPVILFLVPI